MEKKQDIRKELLRKRNSLTEQTREKYSKLIEEKITSFEQYKTATVLLIYASYQSEVQTYGIMKHAFQTGKRVFCPKVLSAGIMEFYEITSLEDIREGYKKIPEPVSLQKPYVEENEGKSLMVMPLVGFDESLNRLGYGGGFYDRYLQKFPKMDSMALGFECQKTDVSIPVEETDIKPRTIITEMNVYKTN